MKPKSISFQKNSRGQTFRLKHCFYKSMKEKQRKADVSFKQKLNTQEEEYLKTKKKKKIRWEQWKKVELKVEKFKWVFLGTQF